jgi:hypothetical protein
MNALFAEFGRWGASNGQVFKWGLQGLGFFNLAELACARIRACESFELQKDTGLLTWICVHNYETMVSF